MPDNELIGRNIRKYRKQNNMTQQELADKIGKSLSAVKKYETGRVAFTLDVLKAIASALNVSNGSLTFLDGMDLKDGAIITADKEGKIIIDSPESNADSDFIGLCKRVFCDCQSINGDYSHSEGPYPKEFREKHLNNALRYAHMLTEMLDYKNDGLVEEALNAIMENLYSPKRRKEIICYARDKLVEDLIEGNAVNDLVEDAANQEITGGPAADHKPET